MNPPSLKIKIPRAINWRAVLNFAIFDTGKLTLILARNSLNPDTAISRSKIIKAGIIS